MVRRIFWDAVILIYLLDGEPKFKMPVQRLLERSFEREDQLFTSCVGLGEVMAGAGKSPLPRTVETVRRTVDEMGFSYLPFNDACVDRFSRLRSVDRVKTADAIHLACAGAAEMDLFITNDGDLKKLRVPGIKFIDGIDTRLL